MLILKCEQSYMDQVKEFASRMGLSEQLQKQLDFLANYATGDGWICGPGTGQSIECELYSDFAPHSFTFCMFIKKQNGKREFFFNGGLIYQGPDSPADGSFPSLTVSLATGTGWFVHT